jgi:antitoxin (DNA-binding transcriptional repressor) of toxin-antitoxin stability system
MNGKGDHMMETYTLQDAQDHLQDLIEEAQQGKTIIIMDQQQRMVQLVPVVPMVQRPRKAGSARGKIWMAPDFDAPLT